MHCREILYTQHCSQRAGVSEIRSTFLYDVRLRSYRASNLPNFWILAYFPHTKPLKRTSGDQPTAQNNSDFPCDRRRSKEVPSGTDFLRLLIGELRTPKIAKIFACGKWPYPYIMRLQLLVLAVMPPSSTRPTTRSSICLFFCLSVPC